MFEFGTSCTFELNNTHFINITNTGNNRTIVGQKFLVPLHSNFECIYIINFNVPNGREGAHYLNLDNGTHFCLDISEFTDCGVRRGNNVYVICFFLKDRDIRMKFVRLLNNEINLTFYYGWWNDSLTNEVPLPILLRTLTEQCLKNGAESDHSYCGYEDYQSGTLKSVI